MKFSVIAFLLTVLIIPLFFSACHLSPMSESSYDYIKSGKHALYEDFELNNGTFSTRYPWKTDFFKQAIVKNADVYAGNWAAKLPEPPSSYISLEVNCDYDRTVSFWYKNKMSSGYGYPDSKLTLYYDSTPVLTCTQSTTWKNATAIIPAGVHTLKWDVTTQWSSPQDNIIIDDIILMELYSNTLPSEQAIVTTTTPLFSWECQASASGYEIQVSTRRDFSDLVINQQDLTVKQFQVTSPLATNCLYYWRLKMKTAANTWDPVVSPVYTFTVLGEMTNDGFETNDRTMSTLNPWIWSSCPKPYLQQNIVHTGAWAVKLNDRQIYGVDSYLQTTTRFSLPKIVTFWCKADAGCGGLSFWIDNTEKSLFYSSSSYVNSPALDWSMFRVYVDNTNMHTLKWMIDSDSSTTGTSAWIDDITITDVSPLVSDGFETNDGTFSTSNLWISEGKSFTMRPFVQSASTHNGSGYAVQFGNDYNDGSSTCSVYYDHTSNKLITFWYKADTDAGSFYFDVDGAHKLYQSFYSSSSAPWTFVYYIIPLGIHKLSWMQDKYYRTATARIWLDDITVTDIQTFANDDFEVNDGTFSTVNRYLRGSTGSSLPVVQGITVHGGSRAVGFPTKTEGSTSYFAVTCDFTTSKTLKFWYKRDAYSGDTIYFYLDSTKLTCSTNDTIWHEYTYTLPSGPHILKWEFNHYQYNYTPTGADKAWIDDITIQ